MLIRVSDLCIGAARAVPKGDPASLQKEATNSMLKTSIGVAKADAERLEDAGDEQLRDEEPGVSREMQPQPPPG
jgi:hypothetical protein